MNAVFLCNNKNNISRAYSSDAIKDIKKVFSLDERIFTQKDVFEFKEIFENTNAIFSTWGMPSFSEDEIKKFFPNLKYVFYAAGSVQQFATEFLNCSVKIFNSSYANAIPVAQYTLGQIILANKGMFYSMKNCISNRKDAGEFANLVATNYNPKIGIIGVGLIGKMVVELLNKVLDCKIYYYDPFLPNETAKKLNIEKAELEFIFENCDCISNHLADKEELTSILNYNLFSKMKPFATFINTARGRQVDEKGLVKALKECTTKTAVLDVTYPEPPIEFSEITKMDNIFLTPHIAGSLGEEVKRMGDYMASEAIRISNGEKPLYEVTKEMLKTMA